MPKLRKINTRQLAGTFLLLLCFLTTALIAQESKTNYTKIREILPPSPNAASLGKYGGLDVGLSSGMSTVNIPIYQYAADNLNIPISLSYSSNGLKVDEIASRVGISWSLNAGGVITRTVMGSIDESSNRLTPPASFQFSQAVVDFAEALSNSDVNDGQPDLFSFNFGGYSGQFMLDNNMNPLLLTHSGLKIEKDFGGTAAWNFKVTAPDGVQYFFGGSSATETTNKYQSGCGKSYPNFAATAWYLTKVVHPSGDVISLSYSPIGYVFQTGVSQTTYGMVPRNNPYGTDAVPPITETNTACQLFLQTRTVLLTQISSSAGGVVKFIYSNRADNGDQLLTRIELYRPQQTGLFRFFNLAYRNVHSTAFPNSYSATDTSLCNRPFLMSVTEGNPLNTDTRVHSFTYNDLDNLPARLSYAQDDYGYFNGKNNNTLIPQPPDAVWASYLPFATANRSPDPSFAVKGMLATVQYPTGGTDAITYEGNIVYGTVTTYPLTTMTAGSSGAGNFTGVMHTSANQTLSSNVADAYLSVSCTFDTGLGYTYDAIHNKALIAVYDVTAGTAFFSQTCEVGQALNSQLGLLTGGHVYQLQVTAYGAAVSASANLNFHMGQPQVQTMNVPTGGARVSRVVTNPTTPGSMPLIKHYYYYNSATPSQSSARLTYVPNYQKYLPMFVVTHDTQGQPQAPIYCAPTEYDYYTMYSNSQSNLYVYPTPVFYQSVIVSEGDNFENGGTEHQYLVQQDLIGQVNTGDAIFGVPLSSYSWKNGKEIYTSNFRMSGTTMVPVRKVFTHFNEDTRVNTEIVSYVVNKKFSPPCQITPPDQNQYLAYDINSYSHFRKWMYPDTVRTWTYNSAGTAYQEELAVSEYGNPSHAMLTKSTVTTSDGKASMTALAYPQDLTLTGPEETARLALVAQNNISAVLSQHATRGTSEVSTTKVNYLVYPNGLVLPHIYNVKVGNNAAQDRVTFNGYNHRGQLTSESLVGGAPVSFIYDYRAIMPVAKVTNADTTSIAYTSFEADGSGRWTIGSSQRDSSTASTGYRSYNLSSGPLSRSGLTSSATYVVSYWTKTAAALTITGTIAGYPITGMKTQNWYYHEHRVTGVTAITLSGTGSIDEVRLYPLGSQMATFTYSPMIGISSSADARSNLSYYEYDGLQRLLNVRDKDGNILKNYNYNYASQAAAWADTGTPECVQGASGNTGEQRVQQTDTNPYSATYGAHRWRSISMNSSSCPVSAGVYVQQTVGSTSVSNGVTYNTLKFNTYSDANCTVLVNAPATLTVNYTYVTSASYADGRTPNPTVTTTNATIMIAAGSNQATSGSIIISGCFGTGTKQICYTPTTQITVQPGTGYTPVNPEI